MDPLNPYAAPQELTPLIEPARPISGIADMLRAGLALYAANAPAVVTVTLLVWTPLELIQAYADYFVFDADDFRGSFRLAMMLEGLVGIIATAGVIGIGAASLRGQRASWWSGLRIGLEAWPRMFWTRIVVGFLMVVGLLLFVVPGIVVWVRTLVAEPIAVLERRNGMDCVSRSFELTRPAAWRMLLLVVIVAVFMVFVSAAIWLLQAAFPISDYWLVSAALSLLIDLVAAWPILTLLAAYWSLAYPQGVVPDPSPSQAEEVPHRAQVQ